MKRWKREGASTVFYCERNLAFLGAYINHQSFPGLIALVYLVMEGKNGSTDQHYKSV